MQKVRDRFPGEAVPLCTVKVMSKKYYPIKCVVTITQSDLPTLTPLPVAGCDLLQLDVAQWATSGALLQVVDNWPHSQRKYIILWATHGQRRL